MKVTAPTLEELEALERDLHNRKAALLDKHGIFGGGQVVNMQHDVLNKSLDKVEQQIKNLTIQGL